MIRIGIIRGGTGAEYYDSLSSGGEMISFIRRELSDSHTPVDVLITRDGVWHIAGKQVDAGMIASQLDYLFPFITTPAHSGIFSLHEVGVPVVNPLEVHSAALHSKQYKLQEIFSHTDVTNSVSAAKEIHNRISPPWLIRIPGQSLPYKTITTLPDLIATFENNFSKIIKGTIESVAFGEDVVVLVTDTFRNEHPYVFPPLILGSYGFSGFLLSSPRLLKGKYVSDIVSRAKETYQKLGLRHSAGIHFTHTKTGFHLASIEANPFLHPLKYVSVALESVGSGVKEFFKHLVGESKK